MDGCNYLREIKKPCTLRKLFQAIEHSNLRNNYFGSQYFLMSCCFTKIFVHPSVIAAVSYFGVYILKGQKFTSKPFTCSKSRVETLEKGVKYV